MRKWLRSLLKNNPVLPWVVAFLVLNLAVTQYGGTNAKSRIAALRAIVESHTLNIDHYKNWTQDWALAPNGHYYSNKAPGPVFLGLPIFAVTDGLASLTTKQRDANGLRVEPGYTQILLLVLLTQILPIALLVLLVAKELPIRAAHFFALAVLFGNTAAFFFNSYFGHGLAAVLFLACYLSVQKKYFVWAGLLYGFTLLSDYTAALALPAVLSLLWIERTSLKKSLPKFVAGGILPGFLWVWYHTVCFGGPFHIASEFINSDVNGATYSYPQWAYLRALLFGPERGILFTQPWVYAGLFGLVLAKKREAIFAWLVLAGALWVAASTDSWHGGFSAGPRYIAFLFPCLAAVIAYSWKAFPIFFRALLWLGLAVAVGLRFINYPFSNLAPLMNLWTYHINQILHPRSGTIPLRLAIFLLVMASATFFVWKKHRALGQNHA